MSRLLPALIHFARVAAHHKLTHHSYCFAEFVYLGHHALRDGGLLLPVFLILIGHVMVEWIGGDA